MVDSQTLHCSTSEQRRKGMIKMQSRNFSVIRSHKIGGKKLKIIPKSAKKGNASLPKDTPPPQQPSVVSLFAGIGGFDLGFETAGASVSFQCELDPFCRSVLKNHWPDAKLHADILKLKPTDLPSADIWTAGFPCQDVSLARGNHGRNGLKGQHTSLFFDLISLLEVKKPRVVLLENVVGLLNSHGGSDFAIILHELASRGYAVSWRVLNARYFGTPQSRSRVFLCAWLGNFEQAVAALYEPVPGSLRERERLGFLKPSNHAKTGAIVPEISYCVAATSGRHTGNDWARSYISYRKRVRRPTPTESERLQGFPANWTVPPADFREQARGYDSERYKAIGNAVAVPVVTWIAKKILANLEGKRSRRTDFFATVERLAPDLHDSVRWENFEDIQQKFESGDFTHRWKTGGCIWAGKLIEATASPAPSRIIDSRFVDILDQDIPDDGYFITRNAAIGIIRRADVVGRTLFPPMRAALEAMVATPHPIPHDPQDRDIRGESLGVTGIRKTRSIQRGKIKGTGASYTRAVLGTS